MSQFDLHDLNLLASALATALDGDFISKEQAQEAFRDALKNAGPYRPAAAPAPSNV